jgi:hypothetical protein
MFIAVTPKTELEMAAGCTHRPRTETSESIEPTPGIAAAGVPPRSNGGKQEEEATAGLNSIVGR